MNVRRLLVVVVVVAVGLQLRAKGKTPPKVPVATGSNVAAVKQLEAERDAPPVNASRTVSADEVVRMTAFANLSAPDTPGNPSALTVCATLFDRSGRAVAAEGTFSANSELNLGGMHVYAPMFSPVQNAGGSSPLGFCPSGGEVWPDRLAAMRGKSFAIELVFTGESGHSVRASTSVLF